MASTVAASFDHGHRARVYDKHLGGDGMYGVVQRPRRASVVSQDRVAWTRLSDTYGELSYAAQLFALSVNANSVNDLRNTFFMNLMQYNMLLYS